ncbi:hypothetical protein CVV38_02915 [Candidatus Peregrinibacteria bacterium HGW-Peregrinibacteria-1]|jgi:hypothetical protein|nr:MAG: hypothetical protein CVV38_02915 [Candidatus Peregrinibacteria bacterium HGW-Peregrinibacteria-1]
MSYGKCIPDLKINGEPAPYPVLNERAIRATAGLMFMVGLSTFWYVFLTKDFTVVWWVVSIFWLEFFLKTVFQPSWSLFGILGRFLVRKQRPEYVGAIQKRFAWGLGLLMASAMIVVISFGIRGIAPFIICLTCLLFMWLESACGICVGSKIYGFMLRKGWLKSAEFRPACPGGACSIKKQN